MHFFHNILHQNHFDYYFIPISSIHSHSTRLATPNNLFLPRVSVSSGKYSLTFVDLKVWYSKPNDIKNSTTFSFKRKLKKNLLYEKDTQLWTFTTFHLYKTKSCEFLHFVILYVLCIFTFSYFLSCTHPILFGMKLDSTIFSILLCFSFVSH